MSAREFGEWMAYETVTGTLGPERADILHAVMMALLYNQWAKKGKEKKPKDFMPEWDKKASPQSPDEMFTVMKAWTVAAGGRIKE